MILLRRQQSNQHEGAIMSVEVTMVKCACSDCICVLDAAKAVKNENRLYCSDECASHHKSGSGCHHAGCACHG